MIRLLIQLALVFLPLLMFAGYRIATRDMERDSQKWPYASLVVLGFALSASFYVIMFLREDRGDRTCQSGPPQFVNGEIVYGETVDCEGASIDSRDGG